MTVSVYDDLELTVSDNITDNYELLELLSEADKGKVSGLTEAVNMIFVDEKQKKKVFEYIKKKKGYVSTEEIKKLINSLFTVIKNGKKS